MDYNFKYYSDNKNDKVVNQFNYTFKSDNNYKNNIITFHMIAFHMLRKKNGLNTNPFYPTAKTDTGLVQKNTQLFEEKSQSQ